ncbi:MAG: alpha/beta fold hydrolase [Desulfobulbales bacterium]|nr:alpha/beta fold hydrolase [Desulfobulbales bacterium]
MPNNIFTFINGSDPARRECFVFLPGWGFPGRIIELAPYSHSWLVPEGQLSPAETLDALAGFLDRHRINSVVPVGWSLGANLAIDFVLRHPEKIKALYLLGMRRSWPAEEIEKIRTDLEIDPPGFMKSFYRKCFLGHQPAYKKFSASLEKSSLAELDLEKLEAGLTYLKNFKLSDRIDKLAKLDMTIYQLHGTKDIIAPPTEIASIPGAISREIKSAGHPVFLDESCLLDRHHRKETIRLKFSRSAATYDENALLQKELAEELSMQLPETPPATILETGCGTGTYTSLLNKRYPTARITAIDFADQMLERARRKLAGQANVTFHCTDAETFLRDSEERYDLVTSNATMHWFDNLPNSARLISEHLSDRGALICSIFGPETMREIKTGLSRIHGKEVVLPSSFFPDLTELSRIFSSLFSDIETKEQQLVRNYPNLLELLRNISKTGTAGWHPGRHLLNRRQIKELEKWFIDTQGGCRVSYQVFMVKCCK